MKIDHLSFAETIERLAAQAGITLRYEEGGYTPGRQQGERTRLVEAHKAAAHKPAVSGSAPASLPRFYVTTSSGPGGRGIQAVVRASASGQVTGTVPVPSALPVEWADSGGTFVTAAADDRSFIIGVQGGQAPTKTGLDLRLFRFAISAAGKPGHLTELAAAPMRNARQLAAPK